MAKKKSAKKTAAKKTSEKKTSANKATAKKTTRRAWTSSDVRELKSLAKKKAGVGRIAKALKRTAGAIAVKAHQLGVSLDTRG